MRSVLIILFASVSLMYTVFAQEDTKSIDIKDEPVVSTQTTVYLEDTQSNKPNVLVKKCNCGPCKQSGSKISIQTTYEKNTDSKAYISPDIACASCEH